MNLREFGSWALSQGQVANPEPNRKYLGQCVSLIQQLLEKVMGIPFKARGNAKDWISNLDVLSRFNKLPVDTKLLPGDILVYGKNYGNGFGHLGFIDANGKYFDQNGVKSLQVGYREVPFKNYICVLRCKNVFKIGNETVEVNKFKVRVNKTVNVRSKPTSKSTKAGSLQLKAGDIFTAIQTVVGENVGENNIWYKSTKGNYVWSGCCSKI